MARCTECNTPNDEERTNCKQCGASFSKATISNSQRNSPRTNLQPSPEEAKSAPAPCLVVEGYSVLFSGGTQHCTLHFINLGDAIEYEDAVFSTKSFEVTPPVAHWAQHAHKDIRRKGLSIKREVATKPGFCFGSHELSVQLFVNDRASGQRFSFVGTINLPIIDQSWNSEKTAQFFNTKKVSLVASASLVEGFDIAQIGGDVEIQLDASSMRFRDSSSGKRTFSPDEVTLVSELMRLEDKPTRSTCISASIAMAADSPWKVIRLFALKDTVLGRQITAPDAAEADIQLDPPTGEQHDQMLGYISRQHAVIRWSGSRFDLDTLGKWGINVDADRLGKGSPPKALKVGQVLRMPGIFPEGGVALEVLASDRHTLALANRDKNELLVIVAPEAKPAAIPVGWNMTVPIFFHHHGHFWLQDAASHKEMQITEGQDIALGASGKGKLVAHPYPELNLVDYMPGTYADREVVSA